MDAIKTRRAGAQSRSSPGKTALAGRSRSPITQRYPIAEEVWTDFWDRSREAKDAAPGEALGVSFPPADVAAPRRGVGQPTPELAAGAQPAAGRRLSGRPVNIVGTGGGPSTFNLSTASAFVAAAMGARVIKTGSRAYCEPHRVDRPARPARAVKLARTSRHDDDARASSASRAAGRSSTRRSSRCWRGRSCRSG